MKKIDPIANAKAAITGPNSSAVEEQAEAWAGAHGRMTPPHSAAQDAIFSNSGGYSSEITHGRGDERAFPYNTAAVSGASSNVDTEPTTLGHPLTPVPHDGFGASGSGVDKITGR